MDVFGFSAELRKPWLTIQQCSQGSACMLEILNVSSPHPARGSEETKEPSEDSSVKIKGSVCDLFSRLRKP